MYNSELPLQHHVCLLATMLTDVMHHDNGLSLWNCKPVPIKCFPLRVAMIMISLHSNRTLTKTDFRVLIWRTEVGVILNTHCATFPVCVLKNFEFLLWAENSSNYGRVKREYYWNHTSSYRTYVFLRKKVRAVKTNGTNKMNVNSGSWLRLNLIVVQSFRCPYMLMFLFPQL